MFLQERLPLVPRPSARRVEEMLFEELGQHLVLAFVLFEAAEYGGAFVHDTRVDPSGREAAKIGSLAAFVYAIFFALFFHQEHTPARIDLLEDVFHDLEIFHAGRAVELKEIVNAELRPYGGFKLEERGPSCEDVGRTRHDVRWEIASGDAG